MQRLILALILILTATGIYFFLQPDAPRTDATPRSTAGSPTTPDPVTPEVKAAAQAHIAQLTGESAEIALDITQAETFVTGDQLLRLPELRTEAVAITSVDSGLAVQGAGESLMISQSQLETGELVITQGASPVVSFSKQASTAPTGSGALGSDRRLRLSEILSNPDLARDTIFYLHAVTPEDTQGLWGILQHGLIETFAKGLKLSQQARTLSVNIPEDADERLENRRSSFLGNVLYNKVQDSYVYNYDQGMLGRDPNLIQQGQQLIIVSYTEAELIAIYNHFVNAEG